jgi:hypothetical protein
MLRDGRCARESCLPPTESMGAVPFSVIASLASSVVLRTFAPFSSMAVK